MTRGKRDAGKLVRADGNVHIFNLLLHADLFFCLVVVSPAVITAQSLPRALFITIMLRASNVCKFID